MAIERISTDGTQRILCLFNFTAQDSPLHDQDKILSYFPNESAKDLLKGSEILFPQGIYLSVLIKPFGFVLIEYHSSRKKNRKKSVWIGRRKLQFIYYRFSKRKKGDSIDVGVKNGSKGKAFIREISKNELCLEIKWSKDKFLRSISSYFACWFIQTPDL